MRSTIYFLIIFFLFSCTRESKVNPISYGMSHNDYEHKNPLYDALENGISCVEVDIALKDGILCVTHTLEEATADITFEDLYLRPLKNLIEINKGNVYPSKGQFYIYLNPKTDGETFGKLQEILEKYKSILARVDLEGYHQGPIKIVGMGWESMKDQEERFVFAEGNYKYLNSDLPGSSIFLINGRWCDFFTWNGEGDMPIDEELQLKLMVNKAHKKNRVLRFWDTWDKTGEKRDAVWKKMLECGVDFINTDDLNGLREFHLNFQKKNLNIIANTEVSFNYTKKGLQFETSGVVRLANGMLNQFSNGIENRNKKIQTKLLAKNIISIKSGKPEQGSEPISFGFDNIPNLKEGIAAYLFGDWESWIKPVRFESLSEFPKEKVEFALWKYEDGMYGAMIPMIDDNYVSMLGNDGISMGAFSKSYSAIASDSIPFMIVGFDDDPYRLVTDIYEKGLKEMRRENNLRKYKDYPEAFEQLTWCTWNAMYEDVSEKKILNGIKTFKEIGIAIPTLLIDDGWLEASSDNKLSSFEFDKEKFPNGAAPLIKELEKNHDVKNVGVWHTMNGYWSGIEPNGKVFNDEKNQLLAYRDKKNVHDSNWSKDIYYSPSPFDGKAYTFYNNWYKYLSKQGISFVKVDQQSVIKRIAKGQEETGVNHMAFGEVARSMESGLQQAVRKFFNGQIINCQDMAIEALYNMGGSAIIRNSDDFFPDRMAYYSLEVEKGNASAHTIMNIHNSLWTSQMAWPDYDMFQSHHMDAEYHAVLRAISGGPIFLSDVPGKQNAQIIKKLCLKNGEVIRADQPGRATRDCLFTVNNNKPFKAFSTINGSGLLAIWNSDDADFVQGTWSPTDIEGLQGEKFVAYEHTQGNLLTVTINQEIPVKLKRKEFEYWNIIPMVNDCAVIGLLEKYNASGTVIASVIKPGILKAIIKGSGRLGVVIPTKPKKLIVDGEIFTGEWKYQNKMLIMNIDKKDKNVETDILINYTQL